MVSKYTKKQGVKGPVSFKIKHMSLILIIIGILFIGSLSLLYLGGKMDYTHYYKTYHQTKPSSYFNEEPKTVSELSEYQFQNLEQCKAVSGIKNKLCRASVLSKEAEKSNDVSICSQDSDVKKKCEFNYYMDKATKNKDSSFCDLMEGSEKDKCYLNMKIIYDDDSYCTKINDVFLKKLCTS